MPTFGLLFVLAGFLVMRQVAVGRAVNIPEDTRDAFTAFIGADTGALKEVLARRGTNVAGGDSGSLSSSATLLSDHAGELGSTTGVAVAKEMEKLGSAAKGYRLGYTGPEYYDCSGLMWRACRELKVYNGVRFTTHTFKVQAKGFATPVDEPAVGDIVLWPNHHMGILIGSDSMYSARSSKRTPNIGVSTVSGDADYFGSEPEYWRFI